MHCRRPTRARRPKPHAPGYGELVDEPVELFHIYTVDAYGRRYVIVTKLAS